MVQIENFEEEDVYVLEEEINKFLMLVDGSQLIEIKYTVNKIINLSGEIESFYNAMVIYLVNENKKGK